MQEYCKPRLAVLGDATTLILGQKIGPDLESNMVDLAAHAECGLDD
jgi:hypothetical protein